MLGHWDLHCSARRQHETLCILCLCNPRPLTVHVHSQSFTRPMNINNRTDFVWHSYECSDIWTGQQQKVWVLKSNNKRCAVCVCARWNRTWKILRVLHHLDHFPLAPLCPSNHFSFHSMTVVCLCALISILFLFHSFSIQLNIKLAEALSLAPQLCAFFIARLLYLALFTYKIYYYVSLKSDEKSE